MSLLTRLTRHTARLVLPTTQYAVRAQPTVSGPAPAVYLTFDDGPHIDRTPRILDQLAALNAHATFFLIGRRAHRHRPLVRRILQEGHSLGTHTWSHWSARRVKASHYVDDVQRGRDAVEQIAGTACRLFRPPYGELTPNVLLKLLRTDTRIVQWSHDTKDFAASTPWELVAWFRTQPPEAGAIVLMHDDQAVTSYALESATNFWRGTVDFQAIPMFPGVPTEYGALTYGSLQRN